MVVHAGDHLRLTATGELDQVDDGPERLGAHEVVAIFEELTGDPFVVEETPVGALRA